MKEEEINKYIDEWFQASNKIAEIKSVSAQFFAWHLEMTRIFKAVWQDGYTYGVKEGKRIKSSVVIKKLTEEN